jgi:DNA-directed RNA polymerase subunit K/omega
MTSLMSRSLGHPLLNDGVNAHTSGSRFLLSAIAFLRSKQLSSGAVARVERGGHKPTYIAVLEVAANTISWSRV